MRWILLVVSLAAFALAFSTKSASVLGFCLVLGFGTLFAALFAFAAEKIASTSRPESVLLTDKEINALRASMRKPPGEAPPSSPG